MGQQDAYCSICGGPFNLDSPLAEWTHNTLLLTAAEPDEEGKLIPARFHCQDSAPARQLLRIRASFDEGQYFRDETTAGQPNLRALNPQPKDSENEPGVYGPLLFPVHEVCMAILDQVATQRKHEQNAPPDTIRDEATLWTVLESRFRNSHVTGTHVDRCLIMPEPHDYLGAEKCRNMSWEADDDPEAAAIFEANPCKPESETEAVSLSSRNRERILKILGLARVGDIPERAPFYQHLG